MEDESGYIKSLVKLKRYSLDAKINYCFAVSKRCVENKYKKDSPYELRDIPSFVIEVFYEFSLRKYEYQYNKLDPRAFKCFDCLCSNIYDSQKFKINNKNLNYFMIMFCLWQFNFQTNEYVLYYRYTYLFDKFGSHFLKKFNCRYENLIIFSEFIKISVFSMNEREFISCFNVLKKIDRFNRIILLLTISREEYVKLSMDCCLNDIDVLLMLKTSYSFPFLYENNDIRCCLPHLVPTACTNSILFRLTDNDNSLREALGKILEDYAYFLLLESNQFTYIKKEIDFNGLKSSDVLSINYLNEMLFVECKSFTPNSKSRMLNSESIYKQEESLLKGINQIYKNFKNIEFFEDEHFYHIKSEKKYGLLVLLEDLYCSRKELFDKFFDKYKILDVIEQNYIIEHIKLISLYEFECLVLSGSQIIEQIKKFQDKTNKFNETILPFKYVLNNEKFLSFKKDIIKKVKETSAELESKLKENFNAGL